MITNVSFTEFRNNLSDYIDLLKNGGEISVEDAKKGKKIVTLIAKKERKFNFAEHVKFVASLGGSGLLASKEDELMRLKFRKSFNNRFGKAKQR